MCRQTDTRTQPRSESEKAVQWVKHIPCKDKDPSSIPAPMQGVRCGVSQLLAVSLPELQVGTGHRDALQPHMPVAVTVST